MNSRRLIAAPEAQEEASYPPKPARWKGLAMSALGQKRTFAPQKLMSALPTKADIKGREEDVRLGPIADNRKRLRQQKDRLRLSFRNSIYEWRLTYSPTPSKSPLNLASREKR